MTTWVKYISICMSKTYKEQEDQKALSKNNGKSIRYRIRKQQEAEAKQMQIEELSKQQVREDTIRYFELREERD